MTQSSDKHPSLTEILRSLEKQFGKGAVMRLGEQSVLDVPVVSTGSIGLDVALGVGGFPRGRLIEIFGPEGSGKTTLALSAIAQAQRNGGLCAFIDAEHAVDVTYAQKLGVDVGELLVSQPDHGEQALEIVDRLCQTEAVTMIVVDSVAALIPRAELEGEIGDIHVGLQARLMSQAMRKLAAVASKHGTAVVFINQLRHKIGVTFGSPETTPGGNALKFYASVRLDIRRIGHVKDGDVAQGTRVRVKVVKNKVAPPFRQAEFEILFGSGVNLPAELVDLGVAYGIIEKSGSYYSLDGQRLAQGRERVIELLVGQPDLIDSVRDRVLAAARDTRPVAAPSLDEGEVELVAVGAE